MKQKLLFTVIVLMAMCRVALALNADEKGVKLSDAHIVGHVIDAKTREHLVGITLSIKGTTFGTSTDQTGHYFLKNLKPGTVTVIMSGVGYLSQERTVSLKKGETLEVNFEAVEDNIQLDNVVVTANRQTTLRRLAPTLVNVVDEKQFSRVNAQSLAQGLSFQPGLRVENNCQNCGFNQVRINGLDGHYTQILLDSRPIISSLAGVYGIEQIPTNMIDRVEVVRCGGSALFGSSAISGVVNIITKEPSRNSFTLNESLSLVGFNTVDNSISFNGSLVSDNNRAGASVFGQTRTRGGWDANEDGFTELGKLSARSLGSRVFFKPTDYTRLSAEFHSIQEYRRGGDHLDLPDHVAMISEHVDHNIYSGNIKFDLFSENYKHHLQLFTSGQMVNRNSYYGSLKDGATFYDENDKQTIGILGSPVPSDLYGINYGVTRGRTFMGGAQYTYDFDRLLFMPAQVLIGADVTYDALNDRMPLRAWLPIVDESGKPIKDKDGKLQPLYPTIDQRILVYSQLAQLEWKNDQWSVLLGTRLDEHSGIKRPILSPRATLRYNPTKNINLRASYAKGFRAPQVFDEDLHVGIVGGEAQRVDNDPALKPETSHSASLSMDYYQRWGDVQFNFLVDGFYTRLSDVFSNEEQPSKGDGIKRYIRRNGKGANIYGANIEAKVAYKWLQLQTGWTYTHSRYEEAQEWGLRANFDANNQPIMTSVKEDNGTTSNVYNVAQTSDRYLRTPNFYGYFTIGCSPTKALDIALTGNYTGSMLAPHVIEYGAGSAQSDIAANHKPFEGLPKDDKGENTIRIDELVQTPSFLDLGTKVSYTFNLVKASQLELYVGVNNLLNSFQKDFDLGAARDSGYMYGPLLPGTGYMGFKLTF